MKASLDIVSKTAACLTPEQVAAGLHEARRIITNAAGYYMAGELVPFDAHFKLIALSAIERCASRVGELEQVVEKSLSAWSMVQDVGERNGTTEVNVTVRAAREQADTLRAALTPSLAGR